MWSPGAYGFRFLLEGAGARVVAEASSGEEALQRYAEHLPELLVMDVSMPGIGGLAALERLMATTPQARVLMLSAHNDAIVPLRAMRMGARGYLCKQADPVELIKAAAEIHAGRRYIDPQLAGALAMAQLGGNEDPLSSLTERELTVFMKLAHGLSVNEIADEFCVSPSTVGSHLYRIKQKLNVRNSAEMTLSALRYGVLEQ